MCICCSPLIGGLNGSLGSRVNSGLLDPSTPRGSRSNLNPAAQGSPGQNAAGRSHQASDMQVCSVSASSYSAHDYPTMLDPSTPSRQPQQPQPCRAGQPRPESSRLQPPGQQHAGARLSPASRHASWVAVSAGGALDVQSCGVLRVHLLLLSDSWVPCEGTLGDAKG